MWFSKNHNYSNNYVQFNGSEVPKVVKRPVKKLVDSGTWISINPG